MRVEKQSLYSLLCNELCTLQDIAFPGFEEDYFAGGEDGVVGHITDDEEDDCSPGWNLKAQKTRMSGVQQAFLPLAGGLPHPAFLAKPQKVKKKRKKRVIDPEEGKRITREYVYYWCIRCRSD